MRHLRVLWIAAILLAAGLLSAPLPGAAQPDPYARLEATLRELAAELARVQRYLALYDAIDRIAVSQGRLTPEAAAARLQAKARELYRKSFTDVELQQLRAQHRGASQTYFQGIEQAVAAGTRWPGGATDLYRDRAREELARLRQEYETWVGRGLDALPVLQDAVKVQGWTQGHPVPPPGLDPFAGQGGRIVGALPQPAHRALVAAMEPGAAPPGAAPTGPTPPAGTTAAAPATGEDEHALWRRVYAANTREGYELYLRQFPRGQYADVARAALGQPAPGTPTVAAPATPATPAPPATPVPPGASLPGSVAPVAPVAPATPPAPLTMPPPSGAAALVARAEGLMGQGQYAAALTALDEAARTDPGFYQIHLRRGQALNALGDLAGAAQAYEALLRVASDFPNARAWLGELFLAAGDLGRARGILADELRRTPSSGWAWSFMGTIALMEGRQADAQQAMAEAVRLDPAVIGYRYQNGGFLANTGQHRRAVVEFTSVLAMNPGVAGAYYGLGFSLAQVGAPAQAIQALETYLQQDASSEWSQRARDQLARLRTQAPAPGPSGGAPGALTSCPPGSVPTLGGSCLPVRP